MLLLGSPAVLSKTSAFFLVEGPPVTFPESLDARELASSSYLLRRPKKQQSRWGMLGYGANKLQANAARQQVIQSLRRSGSPLWQPPLHLAAPPLARKQHIHSPCVIPGCL